MDEDFLWGASISPHQVEGSEGSDWSRWEQEYAEELANMAEDRFGDRGSWDMIAGEAEDPDNYISGEAIAHQDRYEEDIGYAADMGLDALRIGIEWSRIQPEEDGFDEEALEEYHAYFDAMEEEGIEPMVTLWHFTNPDWFVDEGGWHSDEAVERYGAYVDRVVEEFGDRVDHWVTLNEPSAWVRSAYGMGTLMPTGVDWPGGAAEDSLLPVQPLQAWRAYTNLAEAHHRAHDSIKDADPDAMVGTANSIGAWRAHGDGWLNGKIVDLLERFEYRDWIDRTEDAIDFVGVNHYVPIDVDVFMRGNDYRTSDMGWPVEPGSLEEVVRDIDGEYDQPVIVTEHGLADREDELRTEMVEEAVPMMERLREDGVDVEGYFHWSLLDNFEWDKGFWPRFGLIEIDHEDGLERRPRESARRYAELIRDR